MMIPSPASTAIAIVPIPTDVPSTWGRVGRRPNWIPDAHSITLFGPGVAALTKEKAASAASSLIPAADMSNMPSGRGRHSRLDRTVGESAVSWTIFA